MIRTAIRCLLQIAVIHLALGPSWARAQVVSPFSKDASPSRPGYEFFVGREYGKPLITVNLLRGVREPGVYHIPIDTSLAQLIAYAGGALESSDLTEVAIRREREGKTEVIDYNLEKSFLKDPALLTLRDRDIVHIEGRDTVDSTLKGASLVATIASIGVSVALINDLRNR